MQQSSLHSAKQLPPPVRTAIEQLLGRVLGDNESVSVRTYEPHEAPTPEQQREMAGSLRQYFRNIDDKMNGVSDIEQEEILDEAIRSVRPGYEPAP